MRDVREFLEPLVLFLLVLLAALALVITGGCVGKRNPFEPDEPGGQPPPDPSRYGSFYKPVKLSEDEIDLTLQFLEGTVTPPPGSVITPVPRNTPQNPCPQNCLEFRVRISIASIPPNASSSGVFAKIRLHLSEDGMNPYIINGYAYTAGIGGLPREATSGEFGNMGQVPLFFVPTWYIAEWEYSVSLLIEGRWTQKEKKGTKSLPTYYLAK